MQEIRKHALPGLPVMLLILLLVIGGSLVFVLFATALDLLLIPVGLLAASGLIGLYPVEPNPSAVLSLFDKSVGTVKESGLRWNNPAYSKKKISLRVRNVESGKLKVNDLEGGPRSTRDPRTDSPYVAPRCPRRYGAHHHPQEHQAKR